ncbi:MAG: hypothetical protein HY934_01035 [Candidatus Firestonebacteria bacterium]|nr:hypothetical protein [Candidatus Firestonebacteria bacterium]
MENFTCFILSFFNGKDGHPSYIAYKGKVYDVTESKLWKNGIHAGRHHAGIDLTDCLSQAPHGEDKIFSQTVKGNLLITSEAKTMSIHKKLFYFIAYLNLFIVIIISFILSIWRWI